MAFTHQRTCRSRGNHLYSLAMSDTAVNFMTPLLRILPRAPLPAEPGPVDPRDYRLFAEAIRFVVAHD